MVLPSSSVYLVSVSMSARTILMVGFQLNTCVFSPVFLYAVYTVQVKVLGGLTVFDHIISESLLIVQLMKIYPYL